VRQDSSDGGSFEHRDPVQSGRRQHGLVGILALGAGAACLAYATIALLLGGPGAFVFEPTRWGVLSGPLAALLAAPICLVLARLVRYVERSRGLEDRDRTIRHALRIETVGDMASMVAHQLRNHLQVMMGQAALGADESPERRARRFETIRTELGASIALLEQLLELSHPGVGSARLTDLGELCRDFAERTRRILPAAIDMEVEVPPGPVEVEVDPQGLEHALLNLVINARHAIRGRGKLTLRVAVEAGIAHIDVSDTGSGIPEADLCRVFEPYFTTKPKGKGTGLGLAAVDRYMRASAGGVKVQSQVGRGTTFRLEFPRAG